MPKGVLLKGHSIAEKLQQDIRGRADALVAQYGQKIKIAALSVGENEGSLVYLKSQQKVSEKMGIVHEIIQFPESVSLDRLIRAVNELNHDDAVHGVIIQMPLPEHLPMGKVLGVLDPQKDIEGIHADNLGLLVLKKSRLVPCTALAVMRTIEESGVDLYGSEVVIVGSSKIVGRPVALLLMDKMATVTVCNIATFERSRLREHVRRAEILIVAAGQPELIPGEWIRKGAVVVDVGINRVNGTIVGDVVFEEAVEKAGYITPVPGGIGPLTVTILMQNAVTAYAMLHETDIKQDCDSV